MKRIVISVLVVAFLLGLGYISLSPQSSAAPPTEPAPEGPVLWKVAENLTLNPGEVFESAWQDARSFRLFKFYACIQPYEGISPFYPEGNVRIRVHESPSSDATDLLMYKIAPHDDYWYHTTWTDPDGWQVVHEFDGLYSFIRVKALNLQSANGTPITVSLYLLAASE